MPRFSIIIVSYESSAWINACLDSLASQQLGDFETIVVDNNSTDGGAERIEAYSRLPIKLIKNDQNLGFSGGCNLGAQAARGEWLIFLNPDTTARPDWLAEIANGQARYPDTSVFACAQFELGGDAMLDGAGDAYFGFGIPWRGGFGHPASSLPGDGECFSPCGASAVVRRSLFLDIGGFDERFFCYCEDVDLGFRLRLTGERCVFLSKAAVDHKGSGISGRKSDFTIYHGTRNRLWTYFKNMPLGMLLLTLPGHIAITAYLLARSPSNGLFKPTWRGIKDGVKGLPAIWKSRQSYKARPAHVRLFGAMSWNVNDMRKRRPCVQTFDPPIGG